MSRFLHIGLFLGLHYEYNRAVLRGIVSYARPSKPWALNFVNWNAGNTIDDAHLDRFDGFLGNLAHRSAADKVLPLGKPLVNISNLFPQPDIPRVGIDDPRLGRTVAKYLLERGFVNFAFSGFTRHGYSIDRERGFAEALREAGHTYASHGAYMSQRGLPEYSSDRYDAMREWLVSLPKPVAIMGANDTRAWEIAEVCRDAGIAVPEDVAIVGADNDPAICTTAFPPLSSVAVPGERIGYEASRMLDELLAGGKAPAEPLLLPDKGVVTRQSSDVLAIPDPELASAVRFIRENAGRRISVRDVIKAVPVARRSLERKFRIILGRSPLEEIRRARLDRARELLAHTDLPMPTIATRAGFESAVRLTTVFREQTGMTPTQFRRQYRMHEQGEEIAPAAEANEKPKSARPKRRASGAAQD